MLVTSRKLFGDSSVACMPDPTVHEKITVGISISLSGKYRLQGEQVLRGVQLWIAHVNQKGGIYIKESARSLPVELIAYDDRSKTDRAKENVVQLIKESRVDILLGPYSSALTMAVAPLAENEKKVLWNHGGASDAICKQGWYYLVSVLSPASSYFRSLPSYLTRREPPLRQFLCFTSSAGTFPAYVAQGLEDAAKSIGLTVVNVPFTSPFDVRRLARTAPMQDSDFLIGIGNFQEDIEIVSHLGGIKPLAAIAAGSTAFGKSLGSKAEGIIGPSQWEPEIHRLEFKGPNSEWFRYHFEKMFGAAPEYTAAQGFATGVVIQEAIRRAGGLGDERLRKTVADLDIHTFYGAFRINPKSGCQIGHQTVLVRWQRGKKVVIWPPEAM
jgi:branched-chain amino acid transport system substrate-binding protein